MALLVIACRNKSLQNILRRYRWISWKWVSGIQLKHIGILLLGCYSVSVSVCLDLLVIACSLISTLHISSIFLSVYLHSVIAFVQNDQWLLNQDDQLYLQCPCPYNWPSLSVPNSDSWEGNWFCPSWSS